MTEEKISFRKKLQDFFESDTMGRKLWDMFIYGLIFVSIIQLMGEYGMLTWNLTHSQNIMMDLIIASIFSVDYIARFYAAPKRWKHFINIFSIIDLFAILPSFIGIGQAKGLRALRILRLLRFLRIIKFIRALEIKDDFQKNKKSEAFEEVAFYDKLLDWYRQNIKKNAVDEFKNIFQLIDATREIIIATNQKIEQESNKMAEDKQTFFISFFELIIQIQIIRSYALLMCIWLILAKNEKLTKIQFSLTLAIF
ncbi:ion transporter [Candidatus Kuenenbacteria bacterium]|nr:ion transporter [Candidatus Kuenenbacteria bacterium]